MESRKITFEVTIHEDRLEVEAWKDNHHHIVSFGGQFDDAMSPDKRPIDSLIREITNGILEYVRRNNRIVAECG